jgi:hypothetical protein
MRKKALLVCWIAAIGIASVVGFVYWEMSRLSLALRTLPVGRPSETLARDLSAQFLGAGLKGNAPNGPQLNQQLLSSPDFIRQRYILVITWTHATKMFIALNNNPPPSEGVMLSSTSLINVPAENRVDGWGNPYCLLVVSKQMTFLSSGGNGVLKCEELRKTALLASSKATDSRLTKEGNLLVTVYERARVGSAVRSR